MTCIPGPRYVTGHVHGGEEVLEHVEAGITGAPEGLRELRESPEKTCSQTSRISFMNMYKYIRTD